VQPEQDNAFGRDEPEQVRDRGDQVTRPAEADHFRALPGHPATVVGFGDG
jgi:hypothetical protein